MSEQIPVIDIPVSIDGDTAKIEALTALFDSYRQAKEGTPLKMPPGASAEQQALVQGTVGRGGRGKGYLSLFSVMASEIEETFKSLNRVARATEKTFKSVNRTLAKMASTLKGIFTASLKWALQFGLLGGLGSWGYGRALSATVEDKQTARGLNVPSGQLKAAGNVYGHLGADSTLHALMQAKGNSGAASFAPLMMLGLNPDSVTLPELYRQLYARFRDADPRMRLSQFNSMQLDALLSEGDFNRVMAAGDAGELPALSREYDRQSRMLAQPSSVAFGAQTLLARVSGNMDSVVTTLVNRLSSMNGPLGDLSDSITESVKAFINGDGFEALVTSAGNALKKFADWINSPEGMETIRKFGNAIVSVTKWVVRLIDCIAGWLDGKSWKDRIAGWFGSDDGKKEPLLRRIEQNSFFLKDRTTPPDPSLWGGVKALGKTLFELDRKLTGTWNAPEARLPVPDRIIREHPAWLDWLFGGPGKVIYTPPGLVSGDEPSGDEPVQHAQSAKRRRAAVSGRPQTLMAHFAALEKTHGLPAGWLYALGMTESSLRPDAVSRAGAAGMFQFMPGTARQYGLTGAEVFDPYKSAQAAARMSADLLRKYNGNAEMALAAYNWGSGNVDRLGMAQRPRETRRHFQRFQSLFSGPAQVPFPASSDGQSLHLPVSGSAGTHIIQVEARSQPGSDFMTMVTAQLSVMPY